MAAWIIDASVAVKWFIREADSAKANRLILESHELHAPDLILIEFANALRKCVRAGAAPLTFAEKSLITMPRLFQRLMPTGVLMTDALRAACALGHPIYDCIYLAASRSSGLPVLTADTVFVAKVAGTPDTGRVILLANWKP